MDAKTIKAISDARSATHDGSKSRTFYGVKEVLENMGVSAESFFATTFGLPYDHTEATQKKAGDGGIDFAIPLKGWSRLFTVDVKGSGGLHGLKVNAKTLRRRGPPDAYVVVGIKKNGHKFFAGWLPGRAMAQMPIKDFGHGPGSEAHLCECDELWSMDEFCTLMALRTDLKYTGPQ